MLHKMDNKKRYDPLPSHHDGKIITSMAIFIERAKQLLSTETPTPTYRKEFSYADIQSVR